MRKVLSLVCLFLLASLSLSGGVPASERSLGNMNVPYGGGIGGIDTLAAELPTIVERSIADPNVPVTLGLDATLALMIPRDNVERSLLRRAQGSCSWDCSGCRESCSIRWKGQCSGGAHCRRGFSNCMKQCWNKICRYCR